MLSGYRQAGRDFWVEWDVLALNETTMTSTQPFMVSLCRICSHERDVCFLALKNVKYTNARCLNIFRLQKFRLKKR